MKSILKLLILVLLFGCSSKLKFREDILKSDVPFNYESVIVLGIYDSLPSEATYIGSVKSLVKGLNFSCDYHSIITLLKGKAKTFGANLIQIEKHLAPSKFSSCHSLEIKMYHVEKLPNKIFYEKTDNLDVTEFIFYKPKGYPTIGKFEVFLNDSMIVNIRKNESHLFKLNRFKKYKITLKSSRFTVELENTKGKRYFIRCNTLVDKSVTMNEVILMDPEMARKEIELINISD